MIDPRAASDCRIDRADICHKGEEEREKGASALVLVARMKSFTDQGSLKADQGLLLIFIEQEIKENQQKNNLLEIPRRQLCSIKNNIGCWCCCQSHVSHVLSSAIIKNSQDSKARPRRAAAIRAKQSATA